VEGSTPAIENVSNSSSSPDQLGGSCDELSIGETTKKIPNNKTIGDIVVIPTGNHSVETKSL
jgi:hypothetical protein